MMDNIVTFKEIQDQVLADLDNFLKGKISYSGKWCFESKFDEVSKSWYNLEIASCFTGSGKDLIGVVLLRMYHRVVARSGGVTSYEKLAIQGMYRPELNKIHVLNIDGNIIDGSTLNELGYDDLFIIRAIMDSLKSKEWERYPK